ncbi:hypothetical protein MSG28_005295 [Choristoneura fumiferana]|uniref:Uncharacterized protein n=1 Tax=Choristoneura fumiferana TaxID=7141 RepID=A0ACC0JQN2_CHOFU|nr:hypothetical protein MSG28_005295 [Choristoneura fumiferana]
MQDKVHVTSATALVRAAQRRQTRRPPPPWENQASPRAPIGAPRPAPRPTRAHKYNAPPRISSFLTRVRTCRTRHALAIIPSVRVQCNSQITMKAITAVCATGASVPAIAGGRIQRHRDGENAEIQMYLSKLQDLVPFMPKNRKISKLEVIQHVIDYICDLQSALENHPAMEQFDAEGALAAAPNARRPLGPRPAPNTILRSSPSQEHRNHTAAEKQSQQDRPMC